jgi:ABC-type glycerol-3-phosphate transport system permease component
VEVSDKTQPDSVEGASSVRPRPVSTTLVGRKPRRVARAFGAHLLLWTAGFFFAFPFLWLLSSSVKTPAQIFVFPPEWIPNPVSWQNYPNAFDEMGFAQYLLNTLTIAVPTVVGTAVSSSMPAYAFARLRWPGRDVVFVLILGTMMLPWVVTLIPIYILFHRLGWIGTYLPLIVPSFFGSAFYIFLLRQFFLTIPLELSEAAKIDGANELRIFVQMILPLSKPALATTILLTFLNSYNDFFGPLIYLTRDSMYTLSIGIVSFVGRNIQKWELLMAASVMYCIPNIILYFAAQKQFVRGIATTGLKG